MKTIIKNYNNARRSKSYWISIMLLGLCLIDMEWIIGGYGIIHKVLIDSIVDFIFSFIPFVPLEQYVYTLIYFMGVFIVFLIVILTNYITANNVHDNSKERIKNNFWFLKELLADYTIGVILTSGALYGTHKAILVSNDLSAISILYTFLLLIGTYYYWINVIPLSKYNKFRQLLQVDSITYEDMYYSISNAKYTMSSFSTFLWKGKMLNKIVDRNDLTALGITVGEEKFTYFIILIDPDIEPSLEFLLNIEKVIQIPHAKINILIMGQSNIPENWKPIIDRYLNIINVRVHYNEMKKLIMSDCIDFDINAAYGKVWSKRNPLNYINNSLMISAYLNSVNSPDLCKKLLSIIIHKLEYLPAIYALFDYIDLQYRLIIAISIDTNEILETGKNWMESNYRFIGNIGEMSEMIKKNIFDSKEPNISKILNINALLTAEEFEIIHRYLPNYKIKTNEITTNTIYLTKELRNVLRGHGSFKLINLEHLYELIFKIALLNNIILETNNIVIEPSKNNDKTACGSVRESKTKNLFPFLCYNQEHTLLVFNNYYKSGIEYINYLEGKIIPPS